MPRRGRGRPKNSVGCESPEFFKVFLPHLCARQLLIPPDFLKDFKRTIKEKVILKDVGGKTWHVDVKETPNGVFLKNGWERFVNYQGIKVGDFLVFRYDGCYSFVVKIYGTNGCKKEALATRNIATKVKVEEETEEETEAEQTSKKRACLQKEGHSFRSNERTRHSKRFGEANELQEQNVASELEESSYKSKNVEQVLPERPYFISLPIQTRKNKLRIPADVIYKHNLHLKEEMVLRNANGKEWPVRTFSRDGAIFIGKGWHAFQNDNNVDVNDRCKFTFETERSSRTINVQILRARPNESHKKRRR